MVENGLGLGEIRKVKRGNLFLREAVPGFSSTEEERKK